MRAALFIVVVFLLGGSSCFGQTVLTLVDGRTGEPVPAAEVWSFVPPPDPPVECVTSWGAESLTSLVRRLGKKDTSDPQGRVALPPFEAGVIVLARSGDLLAIRALWGPAPVSVALALHPVVEPGCGSSTTLADPAPTSPSISGGRDRHPISCPHRSERRLTLRESPASRASGVDRLPRARCRS